MMQAISGWPERISRQTSTPSPSGKPHVEDRHVGTGRRDPRERVLGGAGLADDLDVVLGVEELAHAAAHDFVVVEEEDPYRVGLGAHRRQRIEAGRAVRAVATRQRHALRRPGVGGSAAHQPPPDLVGTPHHEGERRHEQQHCRR